MEYLLYIFTGFAAATAGALPPGAVNLSVVYTTLNQGAKAAIPIILSAAIGEIVLSFGALHCTMAIEEHIQKNTYIQYAIAIILIVVGLLLLFKKASAEKPKERKKNQGFLKGLLLSVLTPPVLIFWLLAFAFITANTDVMLQMGVIPLVIIFFIGIFFGKVFTLWVYMQLSKSIASKANNITSKLNKGIAFLLTIIGLFQLIKLAF